MILDYNYNSSKKNLSISYIKENGAKQVLNFNVERFKSYYKTPTGKYTNWDGSKCDIRWTERPHKFDIKTFIKELPEDTRKLLNGKTAPKLYTFDIETMINEETNEFPEPSEAKFPITVISVVSSDLNCLVLGWKELDESYKSKLQSQFIEYLNNIPFYNELGLPEPSIKYIKFPNEESMIKYFLSNIVAKVPVIAGWNSILFDWQYIQNRCRGYFPNIYFGICSPIKTLHQKRFIDQKQNTINLSMPNHVMVCDMMDVINSFDYVVMPIKDSLSLDYISHEMLGANKIEYEGSLQHLYNTDYERYVFYNAIDSILVQLLDKKFKTLSNIYIQSQYCEEKIESCFSKIQLTEALVFNYFYDNNIKMVPISTDGRERGRLIGAYVKKPIPGKHNWVCCNDFASLYPSTIITCNLSFENIVGVFYDNKKISEYENNPKYIIIGPSVYTNIGTENKPELGRCIGVFLDDEKLDPYRKDPNYFVSVNGTVYKNDKDYAFRVIQKTLKANRDVSKYLSKSLDAVVMYDAEHILNNIDIPNRKYQADMIKVINDIGYNIQSTQDLKSLNIEQLKKFKHLLSEEITYYSNNEQAQKNLGNAMYGGSSHQMFALFSMVLANDITGEARNIIHMMEHHIPEFWRENWVGMKDVHKMLGIEVDEQKAKHILNTTYFVPESEDPDAYHKTSFVIPVYGDTDSNYLSYNELLNSIKGIDEMAPEQKAKIIVDLNLKFMDDHNKNFMEEYYASRHAKSVQKYELETLGHGCWLDVKKRYAQLLLWKDGKYFDTNDLKLKAKGLELVKSSYPKCAREILKKITRFYLEESSNDMMLQKLNMKMQELKKEYMNASIEDICGNINVNNYTKYILDDNNQQSLIVGDKCPANVKALGNYNFIRNKYNLPGEPIYGGKMKVYMYYPKGSGQKAVPQYFAFRSMDYPKWADQYAPVDRNIMFQHYVLDPFNRIIESNNIGVLNIDGSIQMNLFDF